MRLIAVIFMLLVLASGATAQETDTPTPTETLTPTPTYTPTPEPWAWATIAPESTDEVTGQMSRFDYIVTVGEYHIANLLTWILLSIWAMFFFYVFLTVWMRRK